MSDLVCARTCNGCRALEMLQTEPARCTLGFQFDNRFRPAAPCPKPTTIRELIAANRRIDMKIKRYKEVSGGRSTSAELAGSEGDG
jgi:hypothetical protein